MVSHYNTNLHTRHKFSRAVQRTLLLGGVYGRSSLTGKTVHDASKLLIHLGHLGVKLSLIGSQALEDGGVELDTTAEQQVQASSLSW